MRKKLFILSLFNLGLYASAQNSFPYSNSLQTSSTYTVINESTGISLNPTVGSVSTKGVLLTPAQTNRYSGIQLSGIDFKTDRGFNIDFEYFQWGGSNRADGLALVLFDATTTSPTMGAKGAGLGYTSAIYPNNNVTPRRDAFTNGYLAFGIDTYGNFHKRRQSNDEIRNGASYKTTSGSNIVWKDLTTASGYSALAQSGDKDNANSSYFTIRGSVNNPKWISDTTDSDNTKGNPLLYVVNTKYASTGTTSGTINGISLATTEDGSHGSRYIGGFNSFDIRGGGYTDVATNSAYRKAYIQFRKGVRIYYNSDPTINTNATINEEITSYFYDVIIETNNAKYKIATDEQVRISAKNNSSSVIRKYANLTSNSDANSANPLLDFVGKAPDRLKMAFTGSTGTYYQNQLVRNVNIALPFSPNANTDSFSNVCPDTQTIIGKPLANDTGYIDDVYIQRVVGTPTSAAVDLKFLSPIVTTPETGNIDPASFAFMQLNDTTGNYTKVNPTGNDDAQHTFTIANVGTFQYVYKNGNTTLSPADSYITFTPVNGGTAASGTYTLYYTIRNKNTGQNSTNGQHLYDEEYRSTVGTITVQINSTICGKSHIITNKNVTTVL